MAFVLTPRAVRNMLYTAARTSIATASTESRDDANTLRELSALEAMLACSQGTTTRLVGLYWKPTFQALVTRADSSVRRVRQLRDRAIALPPRSAGCSRAVSLRGATTALEAHGMHHRYVDGSIRLMIARGPAR